MADTIIVFGAGELQNSIIEQAKQMGLYVVALDPNDRASCRDVANHFEVVDGSDFVNTLETIFRFNGKAIVTAATDKPLVMMAKVANYLKLNFFSEHTAVISTDKFLMKQQFIINNIPCAEGRLTRSYKDNFNYEYPIIVKPRDSSGSRGVQLCSTPKELQKSIKEALSYSKQEEVLVEEFIDGKEYSVESIHYKGRNIVIQITEKLTTEFPYNVELGHIGPAEIDTGTKKEITDLIEKISIALKFENCASHTELKISSRGIKIIETSPRLGGDFITSKLVPLSTGINMERLLITMALNLPLPSLKKTLNKVSAIHFFNFSQGIIQICKDLTPIIQIPGVTDFSFRLKDGDRIGQIANSLDRYGHVIVQANSRLDIQKIIYAVEMIVNDCIKIKKIQDDDAE